MTFFHGFSRHFQDYHLIDAAAAISKIVGVLEVSLVIGVEMKNESKQSKLEVLKLLAMLYLKS